MGLLPRYIHLHLQARPKVSHHGSVNSLMKSNEKGESVNENGDESGLRVECVPIVHHSRRRYRPPKWKKTQEEHNGHTPNIATPNHLSTC
jgi:hypothetical protein